MRKPITDLRREFSFWKETTTKNYSKQKLFRNNSTVSSAVAFRSLFLAWIHFHCSRLLLLLRCESNDYVLQVECWYKEYIQEQMVCGAVRVCAIEWCNLIAINMLVRLVFSRLSVVRSSIHSFYDIVDVDTRRRFWYVSECLVVMCAHICCQTRFSDVFFSLSKFRRVDNAD